MRLRRPAWSKAEGQPSNCPQGRPAVPLPGPPTPQPPVPSTGRVGCLTHRRRLTERLPSVAASFRGQGRRVCVRILVEMLRWGCCSGSAVKPVSPPSSAVSRVRLQVLLEKERVPELLQRLTVQPALRPSGARPRPPSSVPAGARGLPRGRASPRAALTAAAAARAGERLYSRGSEALAPCRPQNLSSGIRANNIPGGAAW